MKELSIKDKANRYDKAIEIAKSKIKNDKDHILYEDDVIEIFPELKESEDEKMKKSIIYALRNGGFYNNDKTDEAIAWLEKQGEQIDIANKEYWRGYREGKQEILDKYAEFEKQGAQKPQDKSALEAIKEEKADNAKKVESKFHEGDFIKHNKINIICKVISVNSGSYYVENIETSSRIELFNAEQNFHLWSIEDAKDGDVLCVNNEVFIYAHKKQMYSIAVAHCFVDSAGGFYLGGEFVYREYGKTICPATKEQRDLLFQKMKEAGYEWDAENKELKKIEQTIEIPFGAKDSELQEATYYIPDGYYAKINGNEVVIKKKN